MFYYNTVNKGEFTNNEKLAQLMVSQGKWSAYRKSKEPYVMQGDGSGYVQQSKYIAPKVEPTQTIEERIDELTTMVTDINDTLVELMFPNDEA